MFKMYNLSHRAMYIHRERIGASAMQLRDDTNSRECRSRWYQYTGCGYGRGRVSRQYDSKYVIFWQKNQRNVFYSILHIICEAETPACMLLSVPLLKNTHECGCWAKRLPWRLRFCRRRIKRYSTLHDLKTKLVLGAKLRLFFSLHPRYVI